MTKLSWNRIGIGLLWRMSFIFPDKLYLKLRYRPETGRKLNLDTPQRFTEKIQWLKLWFRKPEFTVYVDKLAAKEYVSKKLGDKYIIPTLAEWDNVSQIDISSLPEKFVLKTTHGGGSNGVFVCQNKRHLKIDDIKSRLKKAMKSDIYSGYREWPYKNVTKKVFAEQFMENREEEELTDYKFYCFNGSPEYCQVIANRHSGETIDFYDMDWQHQSFFGLNRQCKQAIKCHNKPECFDEMIMIAKVLSSGLPFLRVDLYEINRKVYFGEMTFYPASGMGAFTPDEWDFKLGSRLVLPVKN